MISISVECRERTVPDGGRRPGKVSAVRRGIIVKGCAANLCAGAVNAGRAGIPADVGGTVAGRCVGGGRVARRSGLAVA